MSDMTKGTSGMTERTSDMTEGMSGMTEEKVGKGIPTNIIIFA